VNVRADIVGDLALPAHLRTEQVDGGHTGGEGVLEGLEDHGDSRA
jgi:hypothetical protein